MRLAFVANNLRAGGGFVVAMNFLKNALPMVAAHDVLVVLPRAMPQFERAFPRVTFIHPNGDSAALRWLWQKTVMTRRVRAFRPEWTYMMGNYALPRLSGRQAMLFHNFNLCVDVRASLRGFAYYATTRLKQIQLSRSLPRVARVYFQTPVPQAAFVRRFGFPEEKTRVLGLSLPEDVTAVAPRARKDGGGTFALAYVSRAWPMKNHAAIVDMYARYRDALRGTRCVFTISETESPFAAALVRRIREAGLSDTIECAGVLAREKVFDLYARSDALLMPTELETLGYPYLEAMYFGCAIITSDRPFARAICGDAALYVDPHDPATLRDAVVRLRDTPAECARLRAAGRLRLAQTTMPAAASVRAFLEGEGIPVA